MPPGIGYGGASRGNAARLQAMKAATMDPTTGTYNADFITRRIGNEKKRARDLNALGARARAGDQQALAELQRLSNEAATPDGKNYARLLVSQVTGQPASYEKPGDASGIGNALKGVGKTLGKVAQFAAPLLAATGIGSPLAMAAMAAGGSVLKGGRPLEHLASGAGAYGAGALRGGGNAAQAAAGAGGGGGGGGILDSIQKALGGGKIGLGDIVQAIPGILGTIESARAGGKRNTALDRQLGLATDLARDQAPLRQAGSSALLQRIAAGGRAMPDFSRIVQTGNPFARKAAAPEPAAPAGPPFVGAGGGGPRPPDVSFPGTPPRPKRPSNNNLPATDAQAAHDARVQGSRSDPNPAGPTTPLTPTPQAKKKVTPAQVAGAPMAFRTLGLRRRYA